MKDFLHDRCLQRREDSGNFTKSNMWCATAVVKLSIRHSSLDCKALQTTTTLCDADDSLRYFF